MNNVTPRLLRINNIFRITFNRTSNANAIYSPKAFSEAFYGVAKVLSLSTLARSLAHTFGWEIVYSWHMQNEVRDAHFCNLLWWFSASSSDIFYWLSEMISSFERSTHAFHFPTHTKATFPFQQRCKHFRATIELCKE